MKIIFAGTPAFAATALAALHAAGFEIVLVLTQPDRPAGRGMQLHPSAVKAFAQAHGIPVAQPVSLRRDGKFPEEAALAHDLLASTPHDVMVVAAYGLILPQSVLDIAPLGCINIHGSLLPRWRGAAPIHRAIEAGDTETGITIMQMDQGLDTGPMLAMEALPILEDDTTGSLHDRLAVLGGRMIVDCLRSLATQAGRRLDATLQPAQGVTYAAKILKEEAALDFGMPANTLARRIRAFNPFPGASAHFGDVTLKLWNAHALAGDAGSRDATVPAGTVLSADAERGVLIACGNGSEASVLHVTELQKPGAKKLSDTDFIKGFALEGGRFT
jgi:methionyl-tRNA formyltransferase